MKSQRPWLKDLRQGKGLTQRELCRRLQIGHGTYHKVEALGQFVDPEIMGKIAEALDFDVELFGMSKGQRKMISRNIMLRNKRPERPYDPEKVILRVDAAGNIFGNYWEAMEQISERDEAERYGNLRRM